MQLLKPTNDCPHTENQSQTFFQGSPTLLGHFLPSHPAFCSFNPLRPRGLCTCFSLCPEPLLQSFPRWALPTQVSAVSPRGLLQADLSQATCLLLPLSFYCSESPPPEAVSSRYGFMICLAP